MTRRPHVSQSSPRRPGRITLILTGPNLLLLAIAAVFLGLWGSVLVGRDTLLAGDLLRTLPPWSEAGVAPAPHNAAVSDPVSQFLPWLTLVHHQWLSGHLPLWNPSSFGGAPLLANDQSAPFSPFTAVTLPFSPAVGFSLAMLLKLVVAGAGMAAFLRQLGVRRAGATIAGLVYASSSFMVVWLGHPHTAVAAIFPWGFVAVEVWLRTRSRWALAGVASVVALQFLAGHAETTLHLGLILGFYALVRALAQPRRRLSALGGLALAALVGTAISGVQLVPFLAELRQSTLVTDRLNAGAGFGHLQLSEIVSWLIPNGHGSPGIDGAAGRLPNYLESTGFIGIAGLLLAGIGMAHCWLRRRSVAVGLTLPVLFAAGAIYGPVSPLTGRIPLLATSNNIRMFAVVCLGLAAFAGFGFQAVVDARAYVAGRIWRVAGWALGGAGALAVLALCALGGLLAARGGGVDSLLPTWHGNIGFWVLVAAASLTAAMCFLAVAPLGRGHAAATGLACLALVEAAIFAGPFQPRVPPSEVPPASPTLAWLQAHAGDHAVAAEGLAMIPDVPAIYGLRDARGVDITIDPRVRLYWSHADPGYNDSAYYTILSRPDARWLAAAGVGYYLSGSPSTAPQGTTPVLHALTSTVSEVPGARPFAFAALTVAPAGGPAADVAELAADPLGAVVVESGAALPAAGRATVRVSSQAPGAVGLDVEAAAPTTVVVLQSFTTDWKARVDTATAPLWPADVLFQAVPVPAGHHQVSLRYEPASVRAGELSSGLGVVALLGLLAAPPLVRWRRLPSSPARSEV